MDPADQDTASESKQPLTLHNLAAASAETPQPKIPALRDHHPGAENGSLSSYKTRASSKQSHYSYASTVQTQIMQEDIDRRKILSKAQAATNAELINELTAADARLVQQKKDLKKKYTKRAGDAISAEKASTRAKLLAKDTELEEATRQLTALKETIAQKELAEAGVQAATQTELERVTAALTEMTAERDEALARAAAATKVLVDATQRELDAFLKASGEETRPVVVTPSKVPGIRALLSPAKRTVTKSRDAATLVACQSMTLAAAPADEKSLVAYQENLQGELKALSRHNGLFDSGQRTRIELAMQDMLQAMSSRAASLEQHVSDSSTGRDAQKALIAAHADTLQESIDRLLAIFPTDQADA